MAVSASAANLAQYANMSNEPLIKAVVMSLRDNGSVVTDWPIITRPTLVAKGARWTGNLPSVNWVPLNTEGTTTSGTPDNFEEQVYILRNNIDIDKFLVLDQNQIQDPRAVQLAAYLKAVAYDINFKFITNRQDSGDANAPIGLRERLRQGSVMGTRSDCLIDAGGVDMSQGGMTATTANNFVEFMDQILWAVNSGEGNDVVLYMNEVMKRRFARAIRIMGAAGGFDQTRDQYGRTIDMYRNAVVKDIGYKADQATRIVTTTELANGTADTGGTFTSIYAVNYGAGSTQPWQMQPLTVKDHGLLESESIYRTFIDWAVGFFFGTTRSVARLFDVKLS